MNAMLNTSFRNSKILRNSARQRLILLVGLLLFWPTGLLGCELIINEIFMKRAKSNRDSNEPWIEIKNLSDKPCTLDALGFSRFDGPNKTLGLRLNYPKNGLDIPGGSKALFVNDNQIVLGQCGDVSIYHLPEPGIKILRNRKQLLCLHTEKRLFQCVDPTEILAESRTCLQKTKISNAPKVPKVFKQEHSYLSSNLWSLPRLRLRAHQYLDGHLFFFLSPAYTLALSSFELILGEVLLKAVPSTDPSHRIAFDVAQLDVGSYSGKLCAINPRGLRDCVQLGEVEIPEPTAIGINLRMVDRQQKPGYEEIQLAYSMPKTLMGNLLWYGVDIMGKRRLLQTTGNREDSGKVRLFLALDDSFEAIEVVMSGRRISAMGRLVLRVYG